jgi:hypothetical protein
MILEKKLQFWFFLKKGTDVYNSKSYSKQLCSYRFMCCWQSYSLWNVTYSVRLWGTECPRISVCIRLYISLSSVFFLVWTSQIVSTCQILSNSIWVYTRVSAKIPIVEIRYQHTLSMCGLAWWMRVQKMNIIRQLQHVAQITFWSSAPNKGFFCIMSKNTCRKLNLIYLLDQKCLFLKNKGN